MKDDEGAKRQDEAPVYLTPHVRKKAESREAERQVEDTRRKLEYAGDLVVGAAGSMIKQFLFGCALFLFIIILLGTIGDK